MTSTLRPVETSARSEGGARRLEIAMVAAGVASFSLLYATQALLPALSTAFGVGAGAASLTVSVATGALALTVLPISALAESVGRARVMTVSVPVAAVVTVLAAASPTFTDLLLARAVVGVALAGVVAVAVAHLTEQAAPHRAGTAVGTYVAGTSLGGLIGRLVPSGVDDLAGWRVAIIALAGLSGVAALAFVLLLPADRPTVRPPLRVRYHLAAVAGHLREPAVRRLAAVGFLLMGGFVAVYDYLGYRLEAAPFGLPTSVVGLLFLTYLAGTASSSLAGRLISRLGRARVVTISIALAVAGLVLTLPDRLGWVIGGLALFTVGFFGAHAVASGWIVAQVRRDRSHASALYVMSYYAGSSVIGTLAGPVFSATGWGALVAGIGSLYVVAGAVAAAAGHAGGARALGRVGPAEGGRR